MYPVLSSSFLFNVVIIRHFNTVNTLDNYGRVRVFTDLTYDNNTLDTVETAHYLYHYAYASGDEDR